MIDILKRSDLHPYLVPFVHYYLAKTHSSLDFRQSSKVLARKAVVPNAM